MSREFCRTKVIIRLRLYSGRGEYYEHTTPEEAPKLLAEMAIKVDSLLRKEYPGVEFVVRVKKGSHKPKAPEEFLGRQGAKSSEG